MEIENWIVCGRAAACRDRHEQNQNHKICAHTADIQISHEIWARAAQADNATSKQQKVQSRAVAL